MNTVTTSKFLGLNLSDLWKGLLMAVLTPVVTTITDSINKGSLTFDWKLIAISAIGGGLAYLVKNFFTPAQTIIKQAPEQGVTTVNVPPPGQTTTNP
jgi:hypothetical protein